MCGITGIIGLQSESILHSMCQTMSHRGPDDAGYHFEPGIGLAMRRLAIIDLKTGSQPISNENGDIWVVFNGEIYNYQDLRTQLKRNGHTLSTTSDTETIVHLYEDHSFDFVHHLRGMFGIAIWDSKKKRLILARDRIGEKPLFYSFENKKLIFGSEIKSILQAMDSRKLNHQAVCDYLAAGYVGGSKTFFKGISKLPPGHMLVWEKGEISVSRYWENNPNNHNSISYTNAVHDLSENLLETTRLCLKSDVEVGAFLSGGIDSSVIVALMRQHQVNVKTFCIGYDGKATGFNELKYAKHVADDLGSEHHELIIGPNPSIDLLPRILWHYDEPHGEPTSVLVFLLCEFTRKHVKVALGGTGGDEIFFGYPRHTGIRMLEYYRYLPRILRKYLVEKIVLKWPESTNGSRFAKRAKRFISGSDLPPESAYLTWVSLLHPNIRESLFSNQFAENNVDLSGDRFLRDHLIGPEKGQLLDRIMSLDVEGYLPEYQLTYMDRMSMAHGLEVRSPFCDFELLKFVTSLPNSYRLKGTRTKHILKSVAKKWIPEKIVERRKVGFDSPIGQWFKVELRNFLTTFLSEENINHSGLLNSHKVTGLIKDHLSGLHDYSLPLWSIIALESWYRMYIEDGINNGLNYSISDIRGGIWD